jgi:uncharacterized ferritin-like protein (DUF455 family)
MNDQILSDQAMESDLPVWFGVLDSDHRAQILRMFRHAAHAAWAAPDPTTKCERVARIGQALNTWSDGLEIVRPLSEEISDDGRPGRPARPDLVEPSKLAQRTMGNTQGRAALLHAIAHIEFNAVNLALDAAWRFEEMPALFCFDWLSVAVDEARHFGMIVRLLNDRSFSYGDFDAHDGLWEMAERTRGDVLERMALVPRVMEARGLDATPPIQAKLRQVGDQPAVDVLDVILREEVRHVALGNRWYEWLCSQRGVEPHAFFRETMRKHRAPKLRGQINRPARIAAGFTNEELDSLLQA